MILINETKTKQESITNRMLLANQKEVDMIIKHIASISKEDFQRIYKLSDKMLDKEYEKYQNPKLIGRAITSYNGLMYKQVKLNDNLDEVNFIADHIRVTTALEGIIEPFTNIYDLRLDFTCNINLNLEEIHDYTINDTVINLCSKEYSSKIKCPKMIDITFIEEDGKEKSTYQKINRGKMLNYLIKEKSEDIEVIKKFKDDNYSFSESLSTETKLVFKRN